MLFFSQSLPLFCFVNHYGLFDIAKFLFNRIIHIYTMHFGCYILNEVIKNIDCYLQMMHN